MLEPSASNLLGTAAWHHFDIDTRPGFRLGDLWLSRLPDGAPVGIHDNRHALVNSGTRGGKGISIIIPNILLWQGSIVVIDPKGEYVQNAGLALRLYEVAEELTITGFKNQNVPSDQRGKILRALEYDADSSALFGCCQIQLNDMENIDGIKPLDLGTRLGMTIFSVYATTWLFEEYQAFMDSQNNTSHPAPNDRLQNLTRVALSDIAPKVEGFTEFHQSICDQFNSMAITGLHKIGQIQESSSEHEFEQHIMQSALKNYRFYGG